MEPHARHRTDRGAVLPIDVVVPVDDSCTDLDACLRSVDRHGGDLRLILIDDGVTDERIRVLFRGVATRGASRVVLLRNRRRVGFARSANRGIAFGRGDVVLLGPDTQVTPGWLYSIRRCAASDPAIGTVTPFSDDADAEPFSLCGMDGIGAEDCEHLGAALEAAAVPLFPDIPAARRYCMFIRRSLVRTIGALAATIGDADRAVDEFCARARHAGYRNVLCDDAFVHRAGRVSRGDRVVPPLHHGRIENSDSPLALSPMERTGDMDYARKVARDDPLAPIRAMVGSQAARLSRAGRPGILHVLHRYGGGTEKYVQDLMAGTHDGYRHYLLRILPDRWRLVDGNAAVPVYYDCPQQHDDTTRGWLGSICVWLRIGAVHVHSLVGSGDDLRAILSEAGLPYCYSVHDMYLACPTVHLIDSHGNYCDATTDVTACRKCLSGFDAMAGVDIEGWRRHHRAFLETAMEVFAPSVWARDTLARYYPGVHATVAPPAAGCRDGEPAQSVRNGYLLPADRCRHIGALGAIGPEKGARHLETLAARIRERGLALRLVVVGYTDRDRRSQAPDKVLTVHGPYESRDIGALLDHYRIAMLVFPTVWPETFSYTLSEGWRAGRPALVPPAGALQERVLASGAGWIMSGWPDADAILDQLVELTAPENDGELRRRAQLARTAWQDRDDAWDPVRKCYSAMLANRDARTGPVVSRRQIHASACRALDMEPARHLPVRTASSPPRRNPKRARFLRLFRG